MPPHNLASSALALALTVARLAASDAPPCRATLRVESLEAGVPSGSLRVGGPFRLVVNLEVQRAYPGPGESLRVSLPHYHGFPMPVPPQTTSPGRPGFTRLLAAPAGTVLEVPSGAAGRLLAKDAPYFFDLVPSRPLFPGERLEAVYGDGPGGEARALSLAVSPAVTGYQPFQLWAIARDGSPGQFLAECRPPVLSGPPASLRVTARAPSGPGTRGSVRVLPVDRFGNPAVPPLPLTVRLVCPKVAGLPRTLAVTAGGVAVADGLEYPAAGTCRLEATAAGGLAGRSNPVVVPGDGRRAWFGDLHIHSGQASRDAYGSFEDVYRQARDVAALDFASKTDHDQDLTEDRWALTEAMVRRFDSPGRFVPFLGFEWTPPYTWGHRSVVAPGFTGRPYRWDRIPSNTPEGLWLSIAGQGGMAIPHNPSPELRDHHHYDWSRHDPERERLVEIYGLWARDVLETETNPNGVQHGLTMGYHLGFTGGSDSHCGLAGRTGGLTGVWAPALTREELWDALRKRRTWATTGQRMVVDFRVAGRPQGESVTVTGPVAVEAAVHGTVPLERLEVIRGRKGDPIPLEPVHTVRVASGEDAHLRWRDAPPVRETFYYLRAFQADGGCAWASPVWVCPPKESSGPRPPAALARDVRSWQPVQLPAFEAAGAMVEPSRDTIELATLPAGARAAFVLHHVPFRTETLLNHYFHVRTPLFLPPAAGPPPPASDRARPPSWRLRLSVWTEHPAVVIAKLMDQSCRTAGLDLAAELPGNGRCETLVREFFWAGPARPIRLAVFLPARSNRVLVTDAALEQAR
ncbi:MAG: DUF3604 domain-containing protein [Candidatus Riflebacteria bacterium]|nr:DUF3604 domain-containing protein [Candidatus Riflebacteria bacterium]